MNKKTTPEMYTTKAALASEVALTTENIVISSIHESELIKITKLSKQKQKQAIEDLISFGYISYFNEGIFSLNFITKEDFDNKDFKGVNSWNQ
jgi:hypothetical protein